MYATYYNGVVCTVLALQVRARDLHIDASVPILAVEYVAPNPYNTYKALSIFSRYLHIPIWSSQSPLVVETKLSQHRLEHPHEQ